MKQPLIVLLSYMLAISACTGVDQHAFQKEIAVVKETIEFDNSKDIMIVAEKGTALYFEAGSFELPDGSVPKGKISLQLKECYNTSDMVRENLTTVSDGRLLETSGMVNIAAFADGQELKLKEGKEFIIHFPKPATDSNRQMNLFYGEKADTGGVNWKIDTGSLVKYGLSATGWSYEGYSSGDSAQDGVFQIAGKEPYNLFEYIYDNFDMRKVNTSNSIMVEYEVSFTLDTKGRMGNIQIRAGRFIDTGFVYLPDSTVDPYFMQFMKGVPPLVPLYDKIDDRLNPIESRCGMTLTFAQQPQTYLINEKYKEEFRKKYASFRDSSVGTMNATDLQYYIFSASKLGWINCDYFWETTGEKINYAVKVDPASNPDVKLVFKKAKSIMQGVIEGGNIVFNNIPAGEDIKIVAITYKGSKPRMAVANTKTSKEIFDKLQYKDFSLNDLEKELSDK